MKLSLRHKIDQLGIHIPGFKGYSVISCLETDLLLRKYLAGEIEKVRDRLADFIAGRHLTGEIQEKIAESLRTTAYLKDELVLKSDEERVEKPVPAQSEERLLDFDLALLEKLEGLHTPLDCMEKADSLDQLDRVLFLFDEGLAEVDDLFQLRRKVLEGEKWT
jgi:hypothetical protein